MEWNRPPRQDSNTDLTRHRSLGQQLASAIRRDIILGRLATGSVLPQEKLCEVYDVSRIPVRDALLALANEGFLVRNKRNQMVVAKFTKEDLFDTFRIEAYLCGLVAGRAARIASDADLAELDKIVQAGKGLDPTTDREELAKISWKFHHKVNRMADSPRLLATLRAASLPLLQDFMGDLNGWWDVTQDEHQAIADALRRRDAKQAEKLMSRHFSHAGHAFAAFLEENDLKIIEPAS